MGVKEKDKKYIGRDVPPIPIDVVKSKGSYLYDSDGKRYLDFLMGWNVGNIGWGVEEVEETLKKFDGPNYVNPRYLYKPWIELAELLAEITPGKLQKSIRATGGTEAVEIALQAAMSHTKRQKFISIEGSYHGHSIGAMSVGDSNFRKHYKNLLPNCYKIKPPLNAKAGKEVERLLSKGDVAAFISEPIICNLGVVIPEKEFFDIVQAACKKYGTVLIIDEVATGFGRTGKMFASEHYNLKPDIMCLAKGITGGYGGLGATIMTEEVAKSMEYDFSFYSTFGWHPLNVEATLANIKYFLKRKNEILKNVSEMSVLFKNRLEKTKFKYPAEIRVKGLAIGVEFKKEGYAKELMDKCRHKGLLFSDLGPYVFTLFPALNIDKKVVEEGLGILEKSA
jgi:4-aminobutyrate aminotransferase-like enzyme